MIRIVKMALSHMIFILVIIMMVMIIIVIIVIIIIIIIMDCYKRSQLSPFYSIIKQISMMIREGVGVIY
jgi:hypothetical protein